LLVEVLVVPLLVLVVVLVVLEQAKLIFLATLIIL
jgi:hypothetical protein